MKPPSDDDTFAGDDDDAVIMQTGATANDLHDVNCPHCGHKASRAAHHGEPHRSYDSDKADAKIRRCYASARNGFIHPMRSLTNAANTLLLAGSLAVALPAVAFGLDGVRPVFDAWASIAALSLDAIVSAGWIAVGFYAAAVFYRTRIKRNVFFVYEIVAKWDNAKQAFKSLDPDNRGRVNGIGDLGALYEAVLHVRQRLALIRQSTKLNALYLRFTLRFAALTAIAAGAAIVAMRMSWRVPPTTLELAALGAGAIQFLVGSLAELSLSRRVLAILKPPAALRRRINPFRVVERTYGHLLNLWSRSQPFSMFGNGWQPRRDD